jgi:hypothetical protein
MKAEHLQPAIQYLQMLAALGRDPNRELDMDTVLQDLGQAMGVKASWQATKEQKATFDQQQAAQQMAAMAAEAVTKNPELLTGGQGDPAAGGNVVPMRGAA